jgi:hypothetical protein
VARCSWPVTRRAGRSKRGEAYLVCSIVLVYLSPGHWLFVYFPQFGLVD